MANTASMYIQYIYILITSRLLSILLDFTGILFRFLFLLKKIYYYIAIIKLNLYKNKQFKIYFKTRRQICHIPKGTQLVSYEILDNQIYKYLHCITDTPNVSQLKSYCNDCNSTILLKSDSGETFILFLCINLKLNQYFMFDTVPYLKETYLPVYNRKLPYNSIYLQDIIRNHRP
jgi:hypothetical protein